MGYEQKFYIVEKHTNMRGIGDASDKYWAEVIAMFDYSKDNSFAAFVNSVGVDADCYFYADDGNTEVIEDDCGDNLKEISIDALIEHLEKNHSDYRRHDLFLDMLKAFKKAENRFTNLTVLRYGH